MMGRKGMHTEYWLGTYLEKVGLEDQDRDGRITQRLSFLR
jgi:hypothetical protein